MPSSKQYGPNTMEIGNFCIEKSSCEKLRGIIGIVSLITRD